MLWNISLRETNWNYTPKFLIRCARVDLWQSHWPTYRRFGLKHLSSLPARWRLLEWADGPRGTRLIRSLGCVKQPVGGVPSFEPLL